VTALDISGQIPIPGSAPKASFPISPNLSQVSIIGRKSWITGTGQPLKLYSAESPTSRSSLPSSSRHQRRGSLGQGRMSRSNTLTSSPNKLSTSKSKGFDQEFSPLQGKYPQVLRYESDPIYASLQNTAFFFKTF
jgi:hypothetical protein